MVTNKDKRCPFSVSGPCSESLQFNKIVCHLYDLWLICTSIYGVILKLWSKPACMKYLLLFCLVIFHNTNSFAQTGSGITKIFIVRHAEKETGSDPLLTAAGNKRAGDLLRILQNEGIQKIYVSNYRRTQNTADSLRLQLKIDTVHYTADTVCDKLINAIMEHRDFGKTILIIAHSNTIPQIIRKFGVSDHPYGDIPDKEYDNLFLITYKKEKAKLKKMKYGAASSTSAPMNGL